MKIGVHWGSELILNHSQVPKALLSLIVNACLLVGMLVFNIYIVTNGALHPPVLLGWRNLWYALGEVMQGSICRLTIRCQKVTELLSNKTKWWECRTKHDMPALGTGGRKIRVTHLVNHALASATEMWDPSARTGRVFETTIFSRVFFVSGALLVMSAVTSIFFDIVFILRPIPSHHFARNLSLN